MSLAVLRKYQPYFVLAGLAVLCLGGWAGLLYSTLSWRSEVSSLRAERDAAVAEQARLTVAVGDMERVQTRLSSARAEYAKTVQAWAEVRQKLAPAQQELAALTKRIEQASDRVSQTGSVRAEPPKPPVRKPVN